MKLEEMYKQFGIKEEVIAFGNEVLRDIENRFSKIDKMLKDVNHELRCYLSKIRIPD